MYITLLTFVVSVQRLEFVTFLQGCIPWNIISLCPPLIILSTNPPVLLSNPPSISTGPIPPPPIETVWNFIPLKTGISAGLVAPDTEDLLIAILSMCDCPEQLTLYETLYNPDGALNA